MRKLSLMLAGAVFLVLAACSETPQAKKEPEKLEPVTGITALYRMYQMARTWSSDAEVLQLLSTGQRLSRISRKLITCV